MFPTNAFQKILLLFFLLIGALIAVRVFYSGSGRYIFLVWNIFLAWIPMFISQYLTANSNSKYMQGILLSTWLLFFPNALYIITDLIHLQAVSIVPKWFDAILLFTSSFVGLMMAFISLHKVERFLTGMLSKRKVSMLIILFLFLGSFGVYLGRFLRWNSWDIINNPLTLLSSIADRFLFPTQHLQTWSVTFILTAVFYLFYLTIKKLPGYLNRAV